VLLLAGTTRGARAQHESRSVSLSYDTPDPTARALNVAERKIHRGRAGLIASSLLLAGGTITLAIGLSDNITFGKPVPELFVPGALAMTGGFVGLIVSGVALADGKRAKQELEQQRVQLFLGPGGARFRLRF
jgi:hypothetical protein